MAEDAGKRSRRGFLLSAAMVGGLVAGYGLGAVHFLRYLVPLGKKAPKRELFAGPVDQLEVGESKTLATPAGETFVMARTPEGFRVLSDVCPHLGCKVHWKPEAKQFLCPCHNGVFDAEGVAVSGPPAEAKQRLEQLETVVRGGGVFVLIREA